VHAAQDPGPASAPELFTDAAVRKALAKIDAMQRKQEQRLAAKREALASAASPFGALLGAAEPPAEEEEHERSVDLRRQSTDAVMGSPFSAASMRRHAPLLSSAGSGAAQRSPWDAPMGWAEPLVGRDHAHACMLSPNPQGVKTKGDWLRQKPPSRMRRRRGAGSPARRSACRRSRLP
jgi:hypothetical protein